MTRASFLWLVSSLALFLGAAAVPEVSPGENRPVYIEGVPASISWDLTYTSGDDFDSAVMYSRVSWTGGSGGVTEFETPVFDEDGSLVTTNSAVIEIDARGVQDVLVEVSYDPGFNGIVQSTSMELWLVPGGVTLLAPIFVIIIAATTREVLYALTIGIITAAFVREQYNPYQAYLRLLDTYLPESLGNVGHAFVILFTWFLSGLVASISKSGGSFGIAQVFRKFAKTRRSVQLVIFLLGFVIFFDDYANTLILGNTMRAISDALWVSREKLAFLVDATTAPIASLAPISSWIGFEVGLIEEQLMALEDAGQDLEGAGVQTNAYLLFLDTIPSRFYPIFMLGLQFMLLMSMREFGGMLKAERRAMDEHKLTADNAAVKEESESEDELMPKKGTPLVWWNGVVPIVAVITIVLVGLLLTGRWNAEQAGLELTAENIFGSGDSYVSLMYGGFTATMIAWLMYRLQYVVEGRVVSPFAYWVRGKVCPGEPIMTMEENVAAFIAGIKGIFTPILVLILAWAIGAAITDSGADLFFSSALSQNLDPRALPTLTFVIAAIISFCTGTSWGTMSILFPLIVPTAWYATIGRDDQASLFSLVISAILAGAVFGDHCTPISDTTILSSIASRCDLMHHTKTQLPYALSAGAFAILLGYLPVGYSAWTKGAACAIGLIFVVFYVLLIGVRVDHPKRRNDVFTMTHNWIGGLMGQEPQKSAHVYDPEDEKYFVDVLQLKFWTPQNFKKMLTCSGEWPPEDDEAPVSSKTDSVDETAVSGNLAMYTLLTDTIDALAARTAMHGSWVPTPQDKLRHVHQGTGTSLYKSINGKTSLSFYVWTEAVQFLTRGHNSAFELYPICGCRHPVFHDDGAT